VKTRDDGGSSTNASRCRHPAWLASLAVLRCAGATLVDPQNGTVNAHEPLESGTGEAVTDAFRWEWAVDQLDDNDAGLQET